MSNADGVIDSVGVSQRMQRGKRLWAIARVEERAQRIGGSGLDERHRACATVDAVDVLEDSVLDRRLRQVDDDRRAAAEKMLACLGIVDHLRLRERDDRLRNVTAVGTHAERTPQLVDLEAARGIEAELTSELRSGAERL